MTAKKKLKLGRESLRRLDEGQLGDVASGHMTYLNRCSSNQPTRCPCETSETVGCTAEPSGLDCGSAMVCWG